MAGSEAGEGRVSRVEIGVALLVYGLLTVHIFKAALFFGPRVVGAPDTESYPFLWGFYWMAQSVLEEGTLPFQTQLMDFPQGGVLWLKEPLLTFLLIPVTKLFGAAPSYTIAQMFHCIVAGLGLFATARIMGIASLPSIVAGVFYAFMPHTFGEAYNGNLDAMNVEWSALWLAAMVLVMKRPTWKTVILGAVALWLLLIGNQYYALSMAMLCVILAPAYLLFGTNPGGHSLLRRGGYSALAVLLGLLLFAPFAYGLHLSTIAPDQLTLLNQGEQLALEPPHISDLMHLWAPLTVPSALEGRLPPFQDIVYPGLLVVLIALISPLLHRERRWPILFVLFALFFISLSLGPALMFDGELIYQNDEPVWLPWAYLIQDTPILNSMTLPHRMAIPAGLCLAMAMAFSFQGLFNRLPKRAAVAAVLILGALAFAEICLYPPYRVPLYSMSVEKGVHGEFLHKLDAPGAVLNLPTSIGLNEALVYFLHQTQHNRPIAASFRVGTWPTAVEDVPLIQYELSEVMEFHALQPVKGSESPEDPHGINILREQGFGFVVFHAKLALSPQENTMTLWNEILTEALGPAVILSDYTAIFALDPDLQKVLGERAKAILRDDQILGQGTDWAKTIDPYLAAPGSGRPAGQNPYADRLKDHAQQNMNSRPSTSERAYRPPPPTTGDRHGEPKQKATYRPSKYRPAQPTKKSILTGDAPKGDRNQPQDHPPPGVQP